MLTSMMFDVTQGAPKSSGTLEDQEQEEEGRDQGGTKRSRVVDS